MGRPRQRIRSRLPSRGAVRRSGCLRRRLRRAEALARARAESLAVLSHEMREPINGVLGMARLLAATPLDAEQRRYVEAVIDSAEALTTLVNDVLDLSRLDARGLELEPTDFAFRAFLERVCATVAPRAGQRGLRFNLSIASEVPHVVRGDPGRLRQVLVNLLGNALKFTEQGEIVVEAEVVGRDAKAVEIVLRVRDTGTGIPPEAQARIFMAFEQAASETARIYGGSGLGLLIARRIVEAMGGELDVASEPGRGTTFTVRLKLRVPASREVVEPAAELTLVGASLLILDPERRTREAMRDLARTWGMAVRVAKNAGEALALLQEAADRRAPFDFLVVDVSVPDLPAGEVARRVREDVRLAHTRMVLLASSGFRGDAAQARAAGFGAYLPKPASAETLRSCLQQLRAPDRAGKNLITIHSMSERSARPLSVLVVDDAPINRRLATILLERVGHRVTTAGDGASALRAARRRSFDLILMDIQMPDMDGFEAARRIRKLADRRRAGTPIVAVTARAWPGDEARGREAGIDGYLTKPIDGARLLSTVERFARRALHEPADG